MLRAITVMLGEYSPNSHITGIGVQDKWQIVIRESKCGGKYQATLVWLSDLHTREPFLLRSASAPIGPVALTRISSWYITTGPVMVVPFQVTDTATESIASYIHTCHKQPQLLAIATDIAGGFAFLED